MKTPISSGLYALPGEPLMLLDIERNPDTEKGWLAYAVHEVFLRRDSRQGGTQMRVDRNDKILPVPVTIELWMTLRRYTPKWVEHSHNAKHLNGGREEPRITDEQRKNLDLLGRQFEELVAYAKDLLGRARAAGA